MLRLRFLGFKFLFLVAGKGFLQSSWKYYHGIGFLTDFAHSFLVFSGQLGTERGTAEIMDKHKEYVTGKQINLQIYKKLLHVYTVTEDGFFASFSHIVSLETCTQNIPLFDLESPDFFFL